MTTCRFHSAESLCSVSIDGTICCWNLNDGRNMLYLPNILTGIPTSVISLENSTRIACCGNHNHIEIVDLNQNNVMLVLDGHTDWIRSISCGVFEENISRKKENKKLGIILSASEDNKIRFWMLDEKATGRKRGSEKKIRLYATDSVKMSGKEYGSKIMSIDNNEKWSYILVVYDKLWCVYAFNCTTPVYKMESKGELYGGRFITNNIILIMGRAGQAQYYELEDLNERVKFDTSSEELEYISSLISRIDDKEEEKERREKEKIQKDILKKLEKHKSTKSFGRKKIFKNFLGIFKNVDFKKRKSTTLKQKFPNPMHRRSKSPLPAVTPIKTSNLSPRSMKRSISTTSIDSTKTPMTPISTPVPFLDMPVVTHEAIQSRRFMANKKMEEIEKLREEEEKKSSQLKPLKLIKEIKSESFQKCIWKVFKTRLVRIALETNEIDMWEFNVDQSVEIKNKFEVSSIEDGFSVRTIGGKEDITANYSLLEKGENPLVIYGYGDGMVKVFSIFGEVKNFRAHKERITAVLIVPDENSKRKVIVTGSIDSKIKFWSYEDLKLLKTFHFHTGKVEYFIVPPKYFQKKLNNCICSVGSERTIVLYSVNNLKHIHVFGGHSCPIKSVHWRADLDYLIVKCSDSSLYIWQLTTGLFEQRVFGILSKGILEQSEGIGSYKKSLFDLNPMNYSLEENRKGFFAILNFRVSNENPPLIGLMLRVRKLIGFLNNIKDSLKKSKSRTSFFSIEKDLKITDELKTIFAFIFQHGKCNTLDLLRKLLKIDKIKLPNHVGLKGVGPTFSIMIPNEKCDFHPFRFSSVLSAVQIISSIAVLNCLSFLPEIKQICNETKKYFLDRIFLKYKKFKKSSFLWCAQFLKDSTKEIQLAARSVMGSVLNKMELSDVKDLAKKLSQILIENKLSISESKKQNIVVSLAVLSYRVPHAIDKSLASITAMGLMEIMESGGSQHVTAISLLGEGYRIWQHYIPSPEIIWRDLFTLSLPALTRYETKTEPDSLAIDSLKAFLNMSCIDTKLYMDFLSEIILNSANTPHVTLSAAILTLSPLIEKYPQILVRHLVVITSLLMKLLDPRFTSIRKACIKPTIKILRKMVETFPMIGFHQSKQKLAVGNQDGIIVIYDMQTAQKWQLFEAHEGPCRAVCFSPNGKYLSSFSSTDLYCKVWTVDGSGVLDLLGVASRSIKNFEVKQANPKMDDKEVINFVKLRWEGNKKVFLKPGKRIKEINYNL